MGTREKFNSVLPNNSIRSAYNMTPISTVYKDSFNQMGPLENVFYGNDVRLSLPLAPSTAQGSQVVLRIPPTDKIIRRVIFRVQASEDFNAGIMGWKNAYNWTIYSFFERFSYRLPDAERIDFEQWMMLFPVIEGIENPFKKKEYQKLCGRPFKNIVAGQWFYCLLPFPWCSLASDLDRKVFPLSIHLMSQSLEMIFKFARVFPFIPNAMEIIFEYAELGIQDEYKAIAYKFPYKQHYGNIFTFGPGGSSGAGQTGSTISNWSPLGPVSSQRQVQLLGLRPGETTQLIVWFKPTIRGGISSVLASGLLPMRTYFNGTLTNITSTVGYVTPNVVNVGLDGGATSPYGPSPYYGSRLRDLRLTYSGKTIWRLDDNSSQVFNLINERFVTTFGWEDWAPNWTAGTTAYSFSGSSTVAPNYSYFNIQSNPGDYIFGSEYISSKAFPFTFGTAPSGTTDPLFIGSNTGNASLFLMPPTPTTSGPFILETFPSYACLEQQLGLMIENRSDNLGVSGGGGNPGYYYIIPISELVDYYTQNGYSLGADLSGTEVRFFFNVDSVDNNPFAITSIPSPNFGGSSTISSFRNNQTGILRASNLSNVFAGNYTGLSTTISGPDLTSNIESTSLSAVNSSGNSNTTVYNPWKTIQCLAENVAGGNLYVIQCVNAFYQFNGANAVLIQ